MEGMASRSLRARLPGVIPRSLEPKIFEQVFRSSTTPSAPSALVLLHVAPVVVSGQGEVVARYPRFGSVKSTAR